MQAPAMVSASEIKAALRCNNPRCPCQKAKGLTHCPAHNDPKPSLSVTQSNGKILSHCHAGCDPDKVWRGCVAAVEGGNGLRSTSVALALDYKYVGSKNSSVYHYPTCKAAQKIKPENLVTFNSAKDAQQKGYRPCKVCKPPDQD